MIAGSLAPNIFPIFQGYADAVEVNVPLGRVGSGAIVGGEVFDRHFSGFMMIEMRELCLADCKSLSTR
jgi:hypothetical protein